MDKNAKRQRDAYYRDQARYVRVMEGAAQTVLPGFAACVPPVLGFHLISPFGPEPDGHTVFYVVADAAALDLAEQSGLAGQLHVATAAELRRSGYPESGVASLAVRLVAQTAINEVGGSFAYFR